VGAGKEEDGEGKCFWERVKSAAVPPGFAMFRSKPERKGFGRPPSKEKPGAGGVRLKDNLPPVAAVLRVFGVCVCCVFFVFFSHLGVHASVQEQRAVN